MPNLPMPEGLSTTDLECVMIDIMPLDIRTAYGDDLDEDDFFYGDTPELRYAQGPVAEDSAHCTLLFGIHPSDTYISDVYKALDGWEPQPMLVKNVDSFPTRVEGQDYNAVVAKIAVDRNLMVGRKRLEELPHTDPFPVYTPHITLAYIKGTANLDKWVRRMNAAFSARYYDPLGISLGLDD